MTKELQEIVQAARTAQSDAKSARANLKKKQQDSDSLRADMTENVYPFFESQARMIAKLALQVADLDEAVAELEEPNSDSYVTPELAEQLSAALGAGQLLAAELARLAESADELTRKRVDDAIKTHARAADTAWQLVAEAMGEEEEEEDDDEAEETASPQNGVNHGEDDDGEDDEEDEVDTVELPVAEAASEEVTNG